MVVLRKVVGNWGIKASSGKYTLIYQTIFKPETPEAYLKDYDEGFYGTFDQAILGMRKKALRDTVKNKEVGLEAIQTLDDALAAIKKMDDDIKSFLTENKELVNLAYKCKDDYKLFREITGEKEQISESSDEETSL